MRCSCASRPPEQTSNNSPLLRRASVGQRSVLLPGDITERSEYRLLRTYRPEQLRSQILKLAHHGSGTSTSDRFLRAVAPRIAIASSGRRNRYGHPAQEVLDRIPGDTDAVYITPLLRLPEEEFDRIFRINMKGVFLACQVFGQYLVDRNQGGSIINVGSMSGIIPLSRVFTYSATKAAVHNISKNLAREWAPSNIRVNTLVPGFFPAEQNKKVLTPERVSQIMGHTPMNRFGDASELIGATLLLASDAGSFITGTELVVDGGYAAMTI